jgi:DNA-binding IscR family transcriptional regulator
MSINSRFAVAIHILTILAYKHPDSLTSEFIACSVTTNPVVIRRVLGELRRAGLVASQAGNGGGWRLLRLPQAITLLNAYEAVQEGALFAMPPQRPNPYCEIGKTIQQALNVLFAGAEAALEQNFAQTTIADVLARVQTENCPLTGGAQK